MRRWRRWLLLVVGLLVLVGVGYGGLVASTSRSQLARAVVWGESDTDDWTAGSRPAGGRRARPVRSSPASGRRPGPAGRAAGSASGRPAAAGAGPGAVPGRQPHHRVPDRPRRHPAVRGLLQRRRPRPVQTSMSVAKSILGTLVGIAVGEGRIGSVDDPITRYVPELAERDRHGASPCGTSSHALGAALRGGRRALGRRHWHYYALTCEHSP